MDPGTGATETEQDRTDEPGDWPYASLVIFGFFGTDTPEGKRLARRTTAFLALLVVGGIGLRDGYRTPFPDLLWLICIPGSAVGMWWSYTRYLRALDELRRTIQLKAFAFAYGAALTLMVTGLGVALIDPTPQVPRQLLALPVLAELFRGAALAYLARHYR